MDARGVHLVEATIWSMGVLGGLAILAGTLEASFPARDRALAGELIVVAWLVGLAVHAVWRARGAPEPRYAVPFAIARLVTGAPSLAFAMIVAASGLAA